MKNICVHSVTADGVMVQMEALEITGVWGWVIIAPKMDESIRNKCFPVDIHVFVMHKFLTDASGCVFLKKYYCNIPECSNSNILSQKYLSELIHSGWKRHEAFSRVCIKKISLDLQKMQRSLVGSTPN